MDPYQSTITTTSGTPFTAKDHGAMARLVFKRFGEDLTSATLAWKRLLQNSATESDFAELLTWEDTPDFVAPDPTLTVTLAAWKGLRRISLKALHGYLDQMNPFGYLSKVEITEFSGTTVAGHVAVESLTDGVKTHRFHLSLDDGFVTLKAFGRSQRFR